MSWICPECSTCNEDSEVRCIVCDADVPSRVCTLTRARVASLGLTGDVVIPSEFNVIGEGAFKGRGDVTSVTLHGRVKKIEKEAFSGCVNLGRIEAPTKLETVSKLAFADCKALPESGRVSAGYVAPDAYYMTPAAPMRTSHRTESARSSVTPARTDLPTYRTVLEGDVVRAVTGARVTADSVSLWDLIPAVLFSLIPLISLLVYVLQRHPDKGWNVYAGIVLGIMLIGEWGLMVARRKYRRLLNGTQTPTVTALLIASLLLLHLLGRSVRWIPLLLCIVALVGGLLGTGLTVYRKRSLASVSFVGVIAMGVIVLLRIIAWL